MVSRGPLAVRPLRADHAEAIGRWRYAGRDAVYDPVVSVLSAESGYHVVEEQATGELVGFCCYGPEARVPGLRPAPAVLDVGVGLRPDLVGGGWGASLASTVLAFGAEAFGPESFRVAVLAWNERSLRTFRRAGFVEQQVLDAGDGRRFVVLVRSSAVGEDDARP